LAPGHEHRIDTDTDRTALSGDESLEERRRRAIRDVAGRLPGVYEPGYLDRLRDEWR
jgi:hypothetical protein